MTSATRNQVASESFGRFAARVSHYAGHPVTFCRGEIIRAIAGARNAMIDLEMLSDEELETLHARFGELAERARAKRRTGALPRRRPRRH